MVNRQLRVLQVSTVDIAGGAESVALNLFRSYRARGHSSWLAVGYKREDDPDVLTIPKVNRRRSWSGFWLNQEKRLHAFEGLGYSVSRTLLRTLAHPLDELGPRFGVEDFNYPGTHRLLELVPNKPDVVHCHNLHGGYFDLRFVPWLSQQVPLVLTLHDAWLLSGHCAHSFECERWRTGCGQCPDLTLYPAIKRDATAYNWRRKRDIFFRSRFCVSTPSKWLMEKVQQSMLRHAIVDARVIPNGVDLSVFRPADRYSVRAVLNLPQEANIVLFTANQAQKNIWKDYKTLRAAITRIAPNRQKRVLFVCLGGEAKTEQAGNLELRSVSYQKDPKIVAQYYQAADIYVHASRIDTFPCSVLEALACGTPVVASDVGGIPEQVKGLQDLMLSSPASNCCELHEATGVLVPTGNAEAMAEAIRRVLSDDSLRLQMSKNASKDARGRFDLGRQAEKYLEWYDELIDDSVAYQPRVKITAARPQGCLAAG